MQHIFHCIYLIARSGRTRLKMNQVTPTFREREREREIAYDVPLIHPTLSLEVVHSTKVISKLYLTPESTLKTPN